MRIRTMIGGAARAGLLAAFAFALAATSPSPAAAQEKTVWDVSLWGAPRAFTGHVEQLARILRSRTRGGFELRLHYGDLAPARENLQGIADGAFQMAQVCAGYHPEKTRAITVLELPFLGVDTLEKERALSEMLYAHPAVQEEMSRWGATLLMPTPLPQYNLVGRGPAPEDVGWFVGKRIRATGGIAEILSRFGAETVSLTATETRAALESGELDAVAFAPHAHFSFDTISLAEWWTSNLNPGTVNCPVVVNAAALAALPEAHRRALLRAAPVALDLYMAEYADLLDKWSEVIAVFGKRIVTLPDTVVEAFREAASGAVHDAWAAEAEAAGLPGRALLDAALAKAREE